MPDRTQLINLGKSLILRRFLYLSYLKFFLILSGTNRALTIRFTVNFTASNGKNQYTKSPQIGLRGLTILWHFYAANSCVKRCRGESFGFADKQRCLAVVFTGGLYLHHYTLLQHESP